jgi:hypothetical protein
MREILAQRAIRPDHHNILWQEELTDHPINRIPLPTTQPVLMERALTDTRELHEGLTVVAPFAILAAIVFSAP